MNASTSALSVNSIFTPVQFSAPVNYGYEIIDQAHVKRPQVEQFSAQRFRNAHGAHISNFMPRLIALFNTRGDIVAALGLRCAAGEALFLEHYLQHPIEQAISTSPLGQHSMASRQDIVEIGNLASIDRFASRKLFRILALLLISEGYQWATFTGCPSLRKVFSLLGIQTTSLGPAMQSCLPENQQSWGTYFDDNPCVLAGQVDSGRLLLGKQTRSEPGGEHYEIAV